MSLTEQEILRYSRHIILPEVGGRGQRQLRAGRLLLAGLGGVGSAAALYLAAAGIGKLTLWDPADVTEQDLGGAIAHNRERLGQNRAESASVPVQAINPDAEVTVLVGSASLLPAIPEHDLVIATQGDWIAIQQTVVKAGGMAIFAGVAEASGAAMAYRDGEPCLACVAEERAQGLGLRPEGEGPLLSAAAGLMGVIAATEAVKLLLGRGLPLTGRVLTYDGWEARFGERPISRRADCPICGGAATAEG